MTLYAYWLNDTYVGATVYLDGVKGSDANDGLTEDTAVRTFAAAAALISPKVTDGVIWVMHTVTVIDEQTWDLTGRDCVVKRAPSCTGNMILIDGGKLTLSNITIDGNMEAFEKTNPAVPGGNAIYLKNHATLTMNDGATVTNCFGSQGGAFYVESSDFVMNGGTISNNKSKNTGGAIYIKASNASEKASFTMNGGVITGNVSGSTASVLNVMSNPVQLNLLGGTIEKNISGHTGSNACAISATDDKTTLVLGGIKFAGNVNTNGDEIASVTLGTHNGSLIPTETTDIQNPILLQNTSVSTKNVALALPEGLGKLKGKLPITFGKLFVDAYAVSGGTGEDAYQLQQSDLEKLDVRSDIVDAYRLVLNESNTAVLALVETNDFVVYLSGYGNDENDGLTTKTPVKTFEKAKEILKANVDAAENIPDDANFIISVVARVQIKEECTLSFADFGDKASRCMVRRDASYANGYLFEITGENAKVTMESFRVDGNSKYLRDGTSSTFSIDNSAQVTVNDGFEISNAIYSSQSGVFKLGAGSNETTLTINGGWFHDLSGFNGLIVYGQGSSMSWYVPGKCVVNSCLVENVSGTYGLFYAGKFVTIEINGGKYRDLNMSDGVGALAAVQGGAKANLVFNAASEEDAKALVADVYLFNYISIPDEYDDVTISQTSDGYITLGSAVNYDIVINGYYMTWGTTVAVGTDDYDLTQADLVHVKTGSGDSLVLKEKTNSLEIAKTR